MTYTSYTLALSCPNRPGIVSRVSTLLFDCGGNITEAHQFDDAETGRFFMQLVFTLADATIVYTLRKQQEALARKLA